MELLAASVIFSLTVFYIYLARYFAFKIEWLDKPGGRKQHARAVPTVGGVAMFLGFATSLLIFDGFVIYYKPLIIGSLLLIALGCYDDCHGLSALLRLLLQFGCASIIVIEGGVALGSLGSVFFPAPIALGDWAIPITIFCVVGVINAMNMSDGLDGLAAGYALNTFLLLCIAAIQAGRILDSQLLLVMIVVVSAFLLFNYRFPGRRHAHLFMGDAGSMFLGLVLAWFLVALTQGPGAAISPVVSLWFFALPLYDTVSVMIRRIAKGGSPFKADRVHIHHVLRAHGFSTMQTILILHCTSLILGAVGLALDYSSVPEYIMFWSLAGIFIAYCLIMTVAWKKLDSRSDSIAGHA